MVTIHSSHIRHVNGAQISLVLSQWISSEWVRCYNTAWCARNLAWFKIKVNCFDCVLLSVQWTHVYERTNTNENKQTNKQTHCVVYSYAVNFLRVLTYIDESSRGSSTKLFGLVGQRHFHNSWNVSRWCLNTYRMRRDQLDTQNQHITSSLWRLVLSYNIT